MKMLPCPAAQPGHLMKFPDAPQGVQQPGKGKFPFSGDEEIRFRHGLKRVLRAKTHLGAAQNDHTPWHRGPDHWKQSLDRLDIPDIAADAQHPGSIPDDAPGHLHKRLIHRAFKHRDLMAAPGESKNPGPQAPGGQGGMDILGVERKKRYRKGLGHECFHAALTGLPCHRARRWPGAPGSAGW